MPLCKNIHNGITYFDFDSTGYVKTATEVSSDNSALMRNIARHEHVLEQSIVGIARALLCVARGFGVDLPDEGVLKVMFDDSIITDTFQEKKQDLQEAGVTMSVAEFREKWYGEAPDVAEVRAGELVGSYVAGGSNFHERSVSGSVNATNCGFLFALHFHQ